MSNANGHQGGQQGNQMHATDNDLNSGLMLVFGGFFLYILLMILIKYLALISTYIFYPFAMPVFAFAKNGIMAGLIVLIYSVVAFAIAIYFKIAKGKIKWSAFSYGVFWLFVAAGEMLFFKNSAGQVSTPMTAHISKFCNPQDTGVLYLLSCRNTMADIEAIPMVFIILSALVPNIAYGLSGILHVVGNFTGLSKHPKSAAKRKISNVNDLINTVAPYQPHLLIYKSLDPNLVDYNSGQLRFMDSPRRFCFEHDLVNGFTRRPSKYDPSTYKKFNDIDLQDKNLQFQLAEDDDYVPRLDNTKFEEVMMQSLGEVFTSVEALTPTQTAILGIALPLTCRADLNMSEDEAKAILKQTVRQCDEIFKWVAVDINTKHKVNLGFAAYPKLDEFREIIKKWMQHDTAKAIFANHAYTHTIILRCLTDAKKLGVFQPSTLRWLMFYDRSLFAVVQNESRPSVFAENAATSSHYYVELKAKKRIYQPKLQIAYNGFMDNLRQYRYSEKKIKAWELYKQTGDASAMMKEKMVSENFKYGNTDND